MILNYPKSLVYVAIFGFLSSCMAPKAEPNPLIGQFTKALSEEIKQDIRMDSLVLIDSTSYSDNIQYRRNFVVSHLRNTALIYTKSLRSTSSDGLAKDSLEQLAELMALDSSYLERLSDIAKDLAAKGQVTAAYTYKAYLSLNDENQTIYFVQCKANPEKALIYYSKDSTRLFKSPNDFPGFMDMMGHSHH